MTTSGHGATSQTEADDRTPRWGAAGLRRPGAFWLGAAAVTAGVVLHLPTYLGARSMEYRLAGMPWDGWMVLGMCLVLAGLGLVYYALVPRRLRTGAPDPAQSEFDARHIEGTTLTRAHAWLILVLLVAIAIDTMKPFTFTFILPGVATEYGLSTPTHHIAGHLPVGLLPLSGITGTVIGSLVWGFLGDRIGRRASILLACVIFIATAMCGAMPAFWQNILLCFVMGLGAGGLLPIAYALLTETIPARYRGQTVVLVAGAGTAAGFLMCSWLANWLIPEFGWRIMWFLGLPTGVLLIALQRFIPESPRFLAVAGRFDEARGVMRILGLTAVTPPAPVADPVPVEVSGTAGARQLLQRPLRNLTLALALGGIAWGLVNFGFIVWLPTMVAAAGLDVASITGILAKASLFAVPGSLVVAWVYARWSSKGTVMATAVATGAPLVLFAILGNDIARYPALLAVAVAFLLVAMWGLISVLAPYSAEVYPVSVRAGGAGITAGGSKFGGVAALVLSVLAIAPFSVRGTAIISAVPMLAAALAVAVTGVETRFVWPKPIAVPQTAGR